MRKRNIYSIISLWCVLFFCPTLHAERKGFAVVIDSISYQQAQHELAEYIRALESKQHFKVYTVVDRWGTGFYPCYSQRSARPASRSHHRCRIYR